MTPRLHSRLARHYTRVFGIGAVYVTPVRGGINPRIRVTSDPADPQARAAGSQFILWGQRSELGALHRAANLACPAQYRSSPSILFEALCLAASRLKIRLTEHHVVVSRIDTALDRVEKQFLELKASGALRAASSAYRAGLQSVDRVRIPWADIEGRVLESLINEIAREASAETNARATS